MRSIHSFSFTRHDEQVSFICSNLDPCHMLTMPTLWRRKQIGLVPNLGQEPFPWFCITMEISLPVTTEVFGGKGPTVCREMALD